MTTLFLATTGGHLNQLDDVARRLPDDGDAVWVTHANEQSRTLLDGRTVEFVPYVRVRSVGDVARCVPTADRLWRERRIHRIVSTGSGIALGYLPYLAARGVQCHYIESAARVAGPSLTGRLLNWVPRLHRYTQYPSWAGPRWRYGGSVFDGYTAVPVAHRPTDVLRVLVTVGTAAEFPFTRLVRRLAPLLAPGGALSVATGLPVEVLWQTGCTATDGLDLTPTPFLGSTDLARAICDADIVVSHAGAGSALSALGAGRRPLLASRSARLGEAGDDHQAQLAAELERRGLALHRDPAAIGVDDLLATMESTVAACTPPRFELQP